MHPYTELDVKNIIGLCDVFVESKHSRDPFKGSRQRSTRILDRILSDLCGPIDPAARNGCRYFVSFIDDYSYFAIVNPICNKLTVFKSFKYEV